MPAAPTRFTASAMLAALAVVAAAACRRQAERSGSVEAGPPALPVLALSPELAAAVDRIELTRPDDAAPARSSTIVLERRGAAWSLTAPLCAPASADKVGALLANLQELRVWKLLDAGTGLYDRYDLTEGRALHVLVHTGERRTAVEFFAGKSSEQGQLVRLPGSPGLFALVNWGPHGYRGFLYARELRSWRDPTLWTFDEADVEAVEIVNPHGVFTFTRQGASWTGTLAQRHGARLVGAPRQPWRRFDPARVDELLHAYHALAADDFGEARDRATAGLEQPERTGGVVRLHLRQGSRTLVLRVGRQAATDSRFSIPGSRWAVTGEGDAAGDALYALSPWTARWATADARFFERRH